MFCTLLDPHCLGRHAGEPWHAFYNSHTKTCQMVEVDEKRHRVSLAGRFPPTRLGKVIDAFLLLFSVQGRNTVV